MLRTKVVEKMKTHRFCVQELCSRNSCCLWENLEKYDRAGQATDENMTHEHCMLDNKGYKYTVRICNNYCFSNAAMVRRRRLCVTSYVHCLSSCLFVWTLCLSDMVQSITI